jgi:hypothetical protein
MKRVSALNLAALSLLSLSVHARTVAEAEGVRPVDASMFDLGGVGLRCVSACRELQMGKGRFSG